MMVAQPVALPSAPLAERKLGILMLKNALLIIFIFAAVLIVLTFGEEAFSRLPATWLHELTGIAIINLSSLLAA